LIEYCVDCYENLFIRFGMLITIYDSKNDLWFIQY